MSALRLETKQPEIDAGLHLVLSPPVRRRRPHSRLWTARFIQIIFFTNILIIVGLWVKGGNVTAVHTEAGLLASLGRITGLLAAYFLLVQVLLLARLPFLKVLTGFDRLTLWHRWNGRFTVLLILAHVTCITVGYALLDRLSLIGETVSLLTSYPGMAQALIGTILLFMVGVISAVIVRRRLRYETWYAVHLMAYLGIFLAWFQLLSLRGPRPSSCSMPSSQALLPRARFPYRPRERLLPSLVLPHHGRLRPPRLRSRAALIISGPVVGDQLGLMEATITVTGSRITKVCPTALQILIGS